MVSLYIGDGDGIGEMPNLVTRQSEQLFIVTSSICEDLYILPPIIIIIALQLHPLINITCVI